MEYSLLKQIVPNRSYFPLGISTHPTHFPGFDCINPGIGNVASPFSYFVPSHFKTNPNLQIKQQPAQEVIIPFEQEGKGPEPDLTESDKSEEIESTSEDSQKILNQLNARKKKLLDEAIYESFLHPKKIKTETLHLKASPQKPILTKANQVKDKPLPLKLPNTKSQNLKHKFKFE